MTGAYANTEVQVTRSQAQIRDLLVKHRAEGFTFGEGRTGGVVSAQIEFEAQGYAVRIRVPLKEPASQEVSKKVQRSRSKTRDTIVAEMFEQEARRIWRVLHWLIKSRLEAVEEGVETLEQAFLPHLLDRSTGRTMYEELQKAGAVTAMRQLGSGDD